MLHNVKKGVFDWPILRNLLEDEGAQKKLAVNLRDDLLAQRFAGINIDFELDPSADAEAKHLMKTELPKFMNTLKQVFHKANLIVTQDIPATSDAFDYEKLSDANDFVIVMFYDEHTTTGNPGTLASQPWVEDMAEEIFKHMDSSKVILGLANMGYDWPVKRDAKGNLKEESDGELASYAEGKAGWGTRVKLATALRGADEAGAQIQMDKDDLNPYFTYVDTAGLDHIVFMLDAVTIYNEIMALKDYEPGGVALWFLGYEDPSFWKIINRGTLGNPIKPSLLSEVDYGDQLSDAIQGEGEITRLIATSKPGTRKITFDSDGMINSEEFSAYPSPNLLARYGGGDNKLLALTFDDGPDPKYTPEILEVLKKHHVPATFFTIGANADRYPYIVKACWDAGCEIGNHTFNHPDIDTISRLRIELEINATQRTIESIIGHSTKLFRPPYGSSADSQPEGLGGKEIQIRAEIRDLGYLTVGMNIDPDDWNPPGVNEIVSRVQDQLITASPGGKPTQNHIILLHDGGGDRHQTVQALDKIITKLEGEHYKFVTVSRLLGPNEHDRIFPVVAHSQEELVGVDRVVFETSFILGTALQLIFFMSIFLGVLRVLLVAPLALLQSRRAKLRSDPAYAPPVTVIIPAHNEENVIRRTIKAVLGSDYADLRVIVVDDGSVDGTAKIVKKAFGSEKRLTFVAKENGGKSSALNMGISMAETEVIICLDADTIFAKDTISRLVPHLADPKVGAVAGNVKVGNRTNPLTIWQSLEYITTQNFDRRAYAELNSVSVVPGAVGAWRRSAILEVGGYYADTLAEDTDLTFRIRLAGYHVRTENSAIAYTEAPDNLRDLAKQRFRWAFGTLQSLWKHRRMMFKRDHGAFSTLVMPAMWIYSIFFQAFSPVVDLVVILSLRAAYVASQPQNGQPGQPGQPGQYNPILIYYAAFFVLDFLGSFLAVKLDEEDLTQLAWLFWQRFFYRQFMYYVILKSIKAALKGKLLGWGRLQRKDTVTMSGA